MVHSRPTGLAEGTTDERSAAPADPVRGLTAAVIASACTHRDPISNTPARPSPVTHRYAMMASDHPHGRG
jgi:hypothetical protein